MTPDLAIILCSYKGEKFLEGQLDSFDKQSYKNWQLFVYDDGSTDNTKALVLTQKQKHGATDKINFISNSKQMGFVRNFLNGIASTPSNLKFYALSDQDDIWLSAKLERAVSYLDKIDSQVPALYCSRTTLTDGAGNEIGYSPLFERPPSFSNALVQSVAGGNTMVFNKAARDLIVKVGADLDIVSHDWFIYQLISGAGGVVYYDSQSEILYRQHGNNLIGSNSGFLAKLSRIEMILNGDFRNWNDRNIKVLLEHADLLTKENQDKLNIFAKARESWLVPRMLGLIKSGVYRQAFWGNVALFLSGMINRI